jgi:arylsulfatase A-like enzyme
MIVVLFWDGLRPDFVNSDLTPNLCELLQGGVNFRNHHAVFPSETRVNASSVATGCYPGRHGLVANSIYIPQVDEGRALNTGDHESLQAISRVQPLLSAPTLARVLKRCGKTFAIFSSGSPGSSWVQCAPGEGHMVNVRGVVHPENLLIAIENQHGAFPADSVPATGRNYLVTRLMIEAIKTSSYDVIFGWLCDPDLTQHKVGLGAELSLLAIRENDRRLGEILNVVQGIDLMVCSDHGFSTLANPFAHQEAFRSAGFDLEKMVWTGNGVVLKKGYKNKRQEVVDFLAEQKWVGPIFTEGAAGGIEGQVKGTFSYDVPGLNHVRTPDVVFSRQWSDLVNPYGVPGTVFGGGGVASHGSCSPYDLHNVLIAGGPSFKKGEESNVPTGVVDIAPTVQHLTLGRQECDMDGRVLLEGLKGQEMTFPVETEVLETKKGERQQYMQISRVGETRYIDKGWV